MASIRTAPRYLPGPGDAAPGRDTEIERVRTLARILDRYFVDPLIGIVIPGAGDVLGALLGAYTVVIAVRRRVSPVVIARMFVNLVQDALIGLVPIAGDLFDIGFKANLRNAELLADRAHRGGRPTARDWAVVIGAALVYLVVMGLVLWGIIALVRAVA